LALAAGAMLYLVGDELIPEAIGQSVFYTGVGILFGIILMIFLP
jgi:zinc transporter ZupT